MRTMIKGLVAAVAVTTASAAPAMACGYNGCGYAPAYTSYAPVYTYVPSYSYTYSSGCGTCGTGWGYGNNWGYNRLAEPTTQYYYVNQGPTYSGPGAFAPYPTYQENAIPYYGHRYYSGAGTPGPAVYRWHHRYHHAYRHGYSPRRYY